MMVSLTVCLGYNLRECQVDNDDAEEMRNSDKFPDVVIFASYTGAWSLERQMGPISKCFSYNGHDSKTVMLPF